MHFLSVLSVAFAAFPPGGAADLAARVVADENRPGAARTD